MSVKRGFGAAGLILAAAGFYGCVSPLVNRGDL